jgi:hypothetical protein
MIGARVLASNGIPGSRPPSAAPDSLFAAPRDYLLLTAAEVQELHGAEK